MELKGLREATVAFTIRYQGSDPNTVSRVANTLASFYNEENVKAREQQATGTKEFLKVQLADTKKRLDELEQRVSAFKRRHIGELPQQMDTNLNALERLDAQLRQNADSQTRANERRRTLVSQLAEAEAALTDGKYVSPELREAQRLAQKKEELARLRIQFNDNYPDVVLVAAEVAALEREVEAAKAQRAEDAKQLAEEPNATAKPVSPYMAGRRTPMRILTLIAVPDSPSSTAGSSKTSANSADRWPAKDIGFALRPILKSLRTSSSSTRATNW